MSATRDKVRGVVITVSVPDNAQAVKIGRTLVEERLAGAANIYQAHKSFFWWDGVVNEAAETSLVLKTLPENVDAVIARIRQLHEYITPGILGWHIEVGDAEWLKWLATEAVPARVAA